MSNEKLRSFFIDASIDLVADALSKATPLQDRWTSGPSRIISRPDARAVAAGLLVCILAGAVVSVATPGPAGERVAGNQPSAESTAELPWVGVFTGEYVNGAPVYRLPPVTVIADRKVELARLDRADRLARVKQIRSKALAKPAV